MAAQRMHKTLTEAVAVAARRLLVILDYQAAMVALERHQTFPDRQLLMQEAVVAAASQTPQELVEQAVAGMVVMAMDRRKVRQELQTQVAAGVVLVAMDSPMQVARVL